VKVTVAIRGREGDSLAMLAMTGVDAGARVLDLACGMGSQRRKKAMRRRMLASSR
jgi:hypothetical protein